MTAANPVDPNRCRILYCKKKPTKVGTWQRGEEKGLRIPYCDEHQLGRQDSWTDVTPWPDKTLEEIEAEFWKELGS